MEHDLIRRISSWASILLFLALATHQADKPLHLDSVDFLAAASAAASTGRPIYYRGEENPNYSGLYHPPLYIHALAGWFELFGPGAAQARTFGALSALALGWSTLLLAGTLLTRARVAQLAPCFWALFLLNPYTLQCSAMPDIDTSIYGPLLMVFLWSQLRLFWRHGVPLNSPGGAKDLALVVVAMTLCLWAKLTTILALIPFLFLLFVRQLGWRRGFLIATATVAASLALFVGTYTAYCAILDLDGAFTFRFLVDSFSARGRLANPVDNLKYMAPHLARWTGILPFAGMAWAGLLLIWSRTRGREPRALPAGVVLGAAGAVLVYYCSRTLTFGNAPFKYTYVVFGIVVASAAFLSSERICRPRTGLAGRSSVPLALGALAMIVGLALSLRHVEDHVIRDGWTSRYAALALPAAFFLAGAVPWRGPAGRESLGPALMALGVGLHLGAYGGTALHQSAVSYSTEYDYGQDGLLETAAYVSSHVDPGGLITSMKDVGLLSGRRFVENYSAVYSEDAARKLISQWESGQVQLIVFTEGIGQDQLAVQPLLKQWVDRSADLVASFGHYRIYRPRGLPLPAP